MTGRALAKFTTLTVVSDSGSSRVRVPAVVLADPGGQGLAGLGSESEPASRP